jgi:anti-sigma factor RsiW
MSCHDAREWLSDLLDDALEAEARAHVEAHLAGCAECRPTDRLRATVSLLRAVERPQAPAGFVDRVPRGRAPEPPGIGGFSIARARAAAPIPGRGRRGGAGGLARV